MSGEIPTSELVARAQGGDRPAFDGLVRRFHGRLERQVRSRIGDKVGARLEVEDVLQATFAAAFASIAKLTWRGEESFYRWLGSIAEHVIWSSTQKRAWEQIQLPHDIAAAGSSPSRILQRKERFDRLEKALARLSGDHREVVTLARLKGLTIEEIAHRMGRSPEAVKKLIARALLRLRESFGDTESFSLPDERLSIDEDGPHE